jgi:hypothetical protein
LGEVYIALSSSLCSFLYSLVTLPLSDPNILNTLNLRSYIESPTTTKKNSAQAAVIQLHRKFSALNKSLKFHHCVHSSPPLESILNQSSLQFRYSLFINAVSSSLCYVQCQENQ